MTANAVNATVAGLLRRGQARDKNQCVVYPFGTEITTSSFAMYTFSLATLIQALSLVSFSSVADHGKSSDLACVDVADDIRKLSKETTDCLWIYRCNHIHAVSPHRTPDLPAGSYLGDHRSYMPWVLLCPPQLISSTASFKSPAGSPSCGARLLVT